VVSGNGLEEKPTSEGEVVNSALRLLLLHFTLFPSEYAALRP
jgi:hypothetical protein